VPVRPNAMGGFEYEPCQNSGCLSLELAVVRTIACAGCHAAMCNLCGRTDVNL